MSGLLQLVPKNNTIKLIIGLLFIYMLDLVIKTTMCSYNNRFVSKNKEQSGLAKGEIILLIIVGLITVFGILCKNNTN